jgi:3-oxoacid CoA-transferase subunit A
MGAVEVRSGVCSYILSQFTTTQPMQGLQKGKSTISQSAVDRSTKIWLDSIEETINYKIWYCGHYHTSKSIDKMRFMLDDIKALDNK